MFVKKFSASTLEEALKLVKKEFGDGAFVLSSSTTKGTLLKKGYVEVTAAQEKASKPTVVMPLPPNSIPTQNAYRRGIVKKDVRPEISSKSNRYIDIEPERETVRVALKKNSSVRFEDGFMRVGLSSDSSRELAHRLVMDFPKSELGHPAHLEKLKVKLIANQIRVLTPESIVGQRSFIVMGPPGSGKTSYLVKLSLFLREKGIKISLASRERRKVTGPGEMAQYAKILKVPFSHDLRDKGGSGCTLVDLSAMSLRAGSFQNDIDQLLLTLDRPAPFMVLDATQRYEDLMRSADWAERYNPLGVAFTKADLATNLGGVYEFLKKTKIPLMSLSVSDSFRSGLRFFGQLDLATLILSGGFRSALGEGN